MLEKKENKDFDDTELIIEGWEVKGVDESDIGFIMPKLREDVKNITFLYFQGQIYV